jgi:branched-chain amino acid transport system ATP-binding protein
MNDVQSPLLATVDVVAGYGGVRILDGITVEVSEKGVVALLGANGVGKTTLLRAISGLIPCMSGRVLLGGARIDNRPAFRVSRMGVSHVPEGRGIFPGLTVRENLELARFAGRSRGFDVADVIELFPILGERVNQRGGSLSGGEQQMLALGRAIASRPRLLLLDEPSFGLAPFVVQRLYEALGTLKDRGMAMLVAEQAAREVLDLADFVYVIGTGGRILGAGEPAQLLSEMDLFDAYMH